MCLPGLNNDTFGHGGSLGIQHDEAGIPSCEGTIEQLWTNENISARFIFCFQFLFALRILVGTEEE